MGDYRAVWLLCRPGFESDAGQELVALAAELGVYGFFVPSPTPGWVRFEAPGQDLAGELLAQLNWQDLVFSRDWLMELASVEALPVSDRVGAVLDTLRSGQWSGCFGRVEIHVPPEGAAEDLARFARKWTSPLARALRDTGWLAPSRAGTTHDLPRLDILLPDFSQAVLCAALPGNRSPYPAGVPRLKMPSEAPSRSTLKLEEAWKLFISDERWYEVLGGGKKAVDLGAAPGGWTWQLVRQGMLVTAVDNGPMDEAVMASGHVTHVREDGFAWQPKRQVDWLVCDIVDRPTRVASMIADWLQQDLFRYAIFNLKLPMKQRWDTWLACRDELLEGMQSVRRPMRLRARQLYHDREEITCFIEPERD